MRNQTFDRRHLDMAAARKLVSVDFEVFGIVQGVFFRKYTQKQATQLGLAGWVQNTSRGTVVGVAQGPDHSVAQMKSWLANTGSPKSRIEKCDFTHQKDITDLEYQSFDLVREKGDTKPRKKKTSKTTKTK